MSEAKHTRTCCACGALFTPKGKHYRCPPCRNICETARRLQRKVEGNPVISTKMPREYHRKYEQDYFKIPENRERRNANQRKYARAPGTREHHMARWQVRRAIKAGRLIRQPCEVCGEAKVDAHHDDYSKPLDVRWLCRYHHKEYHAKAGGRS